MEGLVVIAVLYVWFSIIRKMVQGQKAQKQAQSAPRQAKAAAARRPASQPQRARRAEPRPVMQPRTSPEYQPMQAHMLDLLREEEQLSRRQVPQAYAGSLGGASTEGRASAEGEDACDPALGHGVAAASSSLDAIYAENPGPASAYDWNRQNLVQAVVMSEILTRPSQRKWGRI